MKSKGVAYLLWLVSGFGWLGFHHFYLGKIGKGIIWIFTLGGDVDRYNTNEELKTIRTASMASAVSGIKK